MAPPFALSILTILALCSSSDSLSRAGLDRVTVPLIIEANRPFIDVGLRKPDGSTRTARFLVDTGGGGFLITEGVARDIGLTWGETMREEGTEFGRATAAPKAFVGELELELDPQRVAVVIGKDNVLPSEKAGRADGMFPGHVLARYHVVFDYPRSTITLARHGVLVPVGKPMPMPVSKRSGFPRTEIEVDGVAHGFLLDTGASFTMVSEDLLKAWGSAHADWPRHPGAFGEAATLGGQTLETMFVPAARWGTHALSEMGVTSQKSGTFEKWMSSMMTAPIVGALAGNVLKRFRVELDYPNEKLYVSAPDPAPGDGAKDGANSIDGTWSASAAELSGEKLPDEARKSIQLIVGDGKYTVMVGAGPDKGTVVLDASKKPKSLDVTGTEGPNKGRTILAIYERTGDTLKICYDLSGKARPTEFKTAKGTQLFLVMYERDKP